MKILVFILFSLLISTVHAQINPKFEQAVVRLHNEKDTSVGWGLIIGHTADSTFVLTAAHVVQFANKSYPDFVPMRLNQISTVFVAKVFAYDIELDYAVIGFKTKLPSYPVPTISKVAMETKLYFIKMVQGKKTIYPTIGLQPGYIEDSDPEKHLFYANIHNVEKGDSGSVFFSEEGVVGIVQKNGDTQFVDIAYLKFLVKTKWKFMYWQLPETPLKTNR